MFALLKKEINSFFGSLIGFLVIIVFLLVNSLFIWVFPGDLNVLESGYSTLDTLFIIAPWVFLFLVPAITMRLFADEKKTGTIEILLTKPLSEMQIILSKYFAAVTLVLFSLVPTLIFFLSVHLLGNGNIDTGGTWGSYIGLFFLASVYAAIGLFASSITDNQIIAFVIGMALAFFFFMGLESISSLGLWGELSSTIHSLGIIAHYKSISRGVIDTRDIIYFVSVAILFLFATRTVLESRKW